MRIKKRVRFVKSFSLAEILIAIIILILAISTILITYLACFVLIDTVKNVNIATTAAQGVIEEIRSRNNFCNPGDIIPFNNIANSFNCLTPNLSGYNNFTFSLNDIPDSRGIVYVDETNPVLLEVTVSICWRHRNRVVGEDQNLNGVLDAGEDANGNGIIDSPAQIITRIADR